MADPSNRETKSDADSEEFEKVVKRLLQTPPKPHDSKSGSSDSQPELPPSRRGADEDRHG